MKFHVILLAFLILCLTHGVAYANPPISFTRVYIEYEGSTINIVGQQIKDCGGNAVHGGDVGSPYFIEIRNPCTPYDKSVTFCTNGLVTTGPNGNAVWSCTLTETTTAYTTLIAYVVLPSPLVQQNVCSAIANTAPWLNVNNCVFDSTLNISYAGMELLPSNVYSAGWVGQI